LLIKRHIRYVDSGINSEKLGGVELWIRQETVFTESISVEQPLGNPNPDIFRRTDFDGKTASYDNRGVEPLVNGAGLFRLDEPVSQGDVVTIELRELHLFTDIILDERHSLMILLWENGEAKGPIYWITAGIAGTLVFSGKRVPDKEDFCKKLKANKTDIPMREYLARMYRVDASANPLVVKQWPDVMSLEVAADYLDISESTIHRLIAKGALKRTPHGKFTKGVLDGFLASSHPKRKKRLQK